MSERIPPLGSFALPSRLSGRPRVSRKDRIVQSTDLDALSSKYSAFKKGYLEDQYLESIVNSTIHHSGPTQPASNLFISKLPVINIGECLIQILSNCGTKSEIRELCTAFCYYAAGRSVSGEQ